MNINLNKILNDTISSVKNTYNTAEKAITSPKELKIVVVHKLDLPGTYGDVIDALDKLSPERLQQIVGIFKKHQKTITKLIESEFK
jgi:hypothetical protein